MGEAKFIETLCQPVCRIMSLEEKLKNVFVLVISGVIIILKWTLVEDPLGHVNIVVSKYSPG